MQDFIAPEENVRLLEVGKNKLYLRRTDPYGFIKVKFERGEVPDSLKGQFTSFDAAKKAVDKYLNDKKNTVKTEDASA